MKGKYVLLFNCVLFVFIKPKMSKIIFYLLLVAGLLIGNVTGSTWTFPSLGE